MKGAKNVDNVVNKALGSAQGNAIQHNIAFDDGYRPPCRIGVDEKGVTAVVILRYNEWKLWRRKDFNVHRIHDPHSLGAVYAFDRHGPTCDREHELTANNIEYCRNKYSTQLRK